MYLNSLLFLFPYDQDDACTSTVYVIINDTELVYPADRMEGGQRLKLPQEATETIVAALAGGTCVSIRVGSFSDTIVPDNFCKTYQNLMGSGRTF